MIFHQAMRKTLCIACAGLRLGSACDWVRKECRAGGRRVPRRQVADVPAGDTDKTLAALHDELQRSKDRLVLPGQQKPYYIEYRLLDLDERMVSAEFGALLTTSTTRNRFMSVDVRVGNYKLDSSNFLSAEGFRGFLGSHGHGGDRSRLQLAAAGYLAGHRSGL